MRIARCSWQSNVFVLLIEATTVNAPSIGLIVLFVAAATTLWGRLLSREARDRRRRDRNYRKLYSKRRDGPAIQLSLNVPNEKNGRKR